MTKFTDWEAEINKLKVERDRIDKLIKLYEDIRDKNE